MEYRNLYTGAYGIQKILIKKRGPMEYINLSTGALMEYRNLKKGAYGIKKYLKGFCFTLFFRNFTKF